MVSYTPNVAEALGLNNNKSQVGSITFQYKEDKDAEDIRRIAIANLTHPLQKDGTLPKRTASKFYRDAVAMYSAFEMAPSKVRTQVLKLLYDIENGRVKHTPEGFDERMTMAEAIRAEQRVNNQKKGKRS